MIKPVLSGTGMFFVGCGIGLIMGTILDFFVNRYEGDNLVQAIIGISQLILISIAIFYFQANVETLGLFISGIIMVQELYILRILPSKKNEKTDKSNDLK